MVSNRQAVGFEEVSDRGSNVIARGSRTTLVPGGSLIDRGGEFWILGYWFGFLDLIAEVEVVTAFDAVGPLLCPLL